MFWGILQRSIFWELMRAFLMSLLALTSILLLAGIVTEASQRGLSPAQILLAIPLIIPNMLPYTIPSTTLFAICVVYGRLAGDNEIIAIKAAGINILKVVWPGVLLGLLTTATTFILYMELIPDTQYMLRTKFLRDVEEFFYGMLKTEHCINHPRLNYAIWVRQVEGKRLLDATFKRRDTKGEFDLIARAREAELLFDYKNKKVVVRMKHGEVYSIPTNAHGFFESQDWDVPMPDSPWPDRNKRKAREMNWWQLQENRELLEAADDELGQEIATASANISHSANPGGAALNVKHLINRRKSLQFEIRNVVNDQHMRPVIAVGCLCFVLVGCPVGIWFSKRDYLSAFITCFLPIVVVYYPLLLCGHSLSRGGRVSPILGLWACDLVAGLVGILLLRRLLKN